MKKALLLFLALTACCQGNVLGAELQDARAAYRTQLVHAGKSPQSYTNENPPAGVREITYPSGNLRLKAWISSTASSGTRKPAVLYLHGGFSFGSDDWADAQAFGKAGYVVMSPMLRGENGNAGNFEMFGGEVDDVLAAGRYLAAQPGVDPARVFVAGHSVGGSLVILAAQMKSPFRASAAFSGFARLPRWITANRSIAPFNTGDGKEMAIRDPYLYVTKIPLAMYSESENPMFVSVNGEFCAMAARNMRCSHETMQGDHGSMLRPSIARAIEVFKALDR